MNATAQLDKITTLSRRIMEKMTDTTPTSDAMILMIMNGGATRKITQLLDETLSPRRLRAMEGRRIECRKRKITPTPHGMGVKNGEAPQDA